MLVPSVACRVSIAALLLGAGIGTVARGPGGHIWLMTLLVLSAVLVGLVQQTLP